MLTISEEIRATQYDKSSASDVWDVSGTVQCKVCVCVCVCVSRVTSMHRGAEHFHCLCIDTCPLQADLEGYPDILLTLSTPGDSSPLDYLLTHPCVQASDSEPAMKNSCDQSSRKLRFSPPVGVSFTLAHYKWSSLSFLPIRGFYQMKVCLIELPIIIYDHHYCNIAYKLPQNVWEKRKSYLLIL